MKKSKKLKNKGIEVKKTPPFDTIVIPTAILKSEITLELVQSMVKNAKDVEPNYIFDITLFNEAAVGGVIVDKILSLSFGTMAKADPEKLYHELRANDNTFTQQITTPKIIDATERMEKK